jgi:AAT family amino acid transporter/D-serine/D-alanine/glycine transporter
MQTHDVASFDAEQRQEARDFHRGLKDRHVQLIALGGAIGVGLFLGSGRAISQAGPGLVFAYAIGGLVIFFIMRALGELLLHRPVAGSFATYAEEYVSPFAGFATGWSYWFMWVVTGMAEITAVGIYTNYWFPELPQWIPALIALGVLYGVNLIAVKLFGELEFWFALIKILAIVGLLVAGPLFLIFGSSGHAETATVANLWAHGGMFPTGVLGVVLALQIVMFAFQGVELLGVTAGEVENPEKSLPKATNAVVWRILVFYIGALVVIMMLVPWTEFGAGESPFVLVFERMGLPAAAAIINFVVITAAASSCNSGIFSTGRMLYTLAQFGQAPKAFGKVNRNHVPAAGITASVIVMLLGVVLNYFIPEQVFVYVTSVALVGTLWTWGMIMLAHIGYRRAVARGEAKPVAYRMPGAPFTNWLVLGFLALVAVFLGFDEGTRIALYVAPIWFGLLALGYRFTQRREVVAYA